jgi:predicted  nucleic acid-binding Zn-ribbon protein
MTVLEALFELQQHDTTLDQLRHRRAHLPLRGEVATLEVEHRGLAEDAKALGVQRDELAARQARLESDVDACERQRASIDRRLASTSVPREAQTMSDEIEVLRARQSTLEDQLIDIMELLEPLDGRMAQLETAMGEIDARLVATRAELVQGESDVDALIENEGMARARAAEPIGAEVRANYEKLRTKLGGIAVARLDHNRCTGCNITLPTIELERIRSAPPEEIVFHEECGRILVR